MSNCKTGDIAIVTWDEAPILSNVGNLVRVGQRYANDPSNGPTWLIEPLDYGQRHLFIDCRDNDKIKQQMPCDDDIQHPDAWLRPLGSPDEFSEEMLQAIVEQIATERDKRASAVARIIGVKEVEKTQ